MLTASLVIGALSFLNFFVAALIGFNASLELVQPIALLNQSGNLLLPLTFLGLYACHDLRPRSAWRWVLLNVLPIPLGFWIGMIPDQPSPVELLAVAGLPFGCALGFEIYASRLRKRESSPGAHQGKR